MLFSGFKKRSISDQTGIVEFEFNVNPTTSTGVTSVGISGTETFGFNFQNSKIYDPRGNLVASYEPGITTTISGQVGLNSFDYYIDDQIIALGNPWNSGKFSWLYVDTNSPVNFEGTIKGRTPNYSLETTGKYQYQNFIVTGKIINNDFGLDFRIFDVSISQQNSAFSVSSFTTGNIAGTGLICLTSSEFGLNDTIVPLTLNTNFGDLSVNFLVSGDYSVAPDIFINISPDTTNVVNNIIKHYNVQISNYPSGTQVGVKLEYVSGITGNIYFFQQQESPLTGILTSGLISGAGVLSSFQYGIVSGLDPKTNIVETGLGSGSLQTDLIFATGETYYDYEVSGLGFGQGTLQIDYFVSGITTGFYEGDVHLGGGLVPAFTINFLGTGDTPGFGTGICQTGRTSIFAMPTGCATLTNPLSYDTDYFSGVVEATKTFSGLITVPYSVLSVGWATGDSFSGSVRTNFAQLFDLGIYNFKKFYSGLITGSVVNTGEFDPSSCLNEQPTSTGVITGDYTLSILLDCSAITGSVVIPITGIPSQIYGKNHQLLDPNTVVAIAPSGGFADTETSYDVLQGHVTRTKTSRMGATISGSGFFQNIVGPCTAAGQSIDINNSATDFYFNQWKENINTTVTSGQFDSNNNYIADVTFNMMLTGTGGDYTGINAPQDSGVLHFVISGEGAKSVALKGFIPSIQDAPTQMVEFFLYKNGEATQVWDVQGSNFDGLGSDFLPSSPWQKWKVKLNENIDAGDTVVVLEDLTSGYYSLYAYVQPLTPPVVFFTQPVFSGCESSQNLIFEVAVSGDMVQDVWVELKDYQERTAHSGVNYDPIYFVYRPESLHITGERKNVYAGGLYFPASAQDYTSGFGYQKIQLSLPIYDNAAFGLDHDFYIELSDPSGATLPFSYLNDDGIPYLLSSGDPYCFVKSMVRINENEIGFPTGVYPQAAPVVRYYGTAFTGTAADDVIVYVDGGGNLDLSDFDDPIHMVFTPDDVTEQQHFGAVITSGLLYPPQLETFYCSPVDPITPPSPPACWPSCDSNGRSAGGTISSCSSDCPNGGEAGCCECNNLIPSGIACDGYPPGFTVNVLPANAKCGEGSVSSECDTDCYIFVGQLCMGHGTSFHDSLTTVMDIPGRTECTHSVLVFDASCLKIQDGDGHDKCAEDGGCPGIPQTPDDISSTCDENGKLLNFTDTNGNTIGSSCGNLAAKKHGRTRPPADGCGKKLVFLKVVCPVDDDENGTCPPTCNPNDELGGNTCSGGACTDIHGNPGQYCDDGGPCFICKHTWNYNFWSSTSRPQNPACPPPP